MAKKNSFYGEEVEKTITKKIWDEYKTAERNQADSFDDFESIIDLLECKREEKDYEWMSDVFIPEYPSIHLTEASQWANQYFPTRDFVDVFLDGKDDRSTRSASASKQYINSMLNVRRLYHYQKYMKARSINSTIGYTYAVCSWKQKINTVQRQVQEQQTIGMNPDGSQMKIPVTRTIPEEIIMEDRFHYDVPDPRNVFTSNDYVYSIQDKEWVQVRSEMSYEQILQDAPICGYINLDLLKKLAPPTITETAKVERGEEREPDKTEQKFYDVFQRFGKIWAIVTERDEVGFPIKMKPPYNSKGELNDNAEFIEAIVTVAVSGTVQVLIRYQPTPFRTSKDIPYRPIIRGLNYINMTKDVGMSDAKYAKELQIALNDTVNMSNDRVKLATLPTLKGRKYALEDNDTLYFQPEHIMMVDNPDDLQEFKISDDINGALAQSQMIINKMQQVESVYPTTMGDLPGRASTTATAIQGATANTNLRANYKSLTFEYTFLIEFYWMMLQMGYQFMHPKTAITIMGKDAEFFDPEADYHYQPVSSNIEVEYNKNQKVKNLDQMMGRVSGLVPMMPGLIFPVLKMMEMQFELLGQEPQRILPYLQEVLNRGMNKEGSKGSQPADAADPMTSNQNGVPVGGLEEQARQNASGLM